MIDNGRVQLTKEQALDRLEVTPNYDPGGEGGPGDCVHTLRDAGVALLGAHWRLTEVLVAIDEHGVEEAGPQASAGGHGLVIIDERGPLFLATK